MAEKTKRPMARSIALARALNHAYCWGSDKRHLWGLANRHVWRQLAMYRGGHWHHVDSIETALLPRN